MKPDRLLSLDELRGATMASMILVNPHFSSNPTANFDADHQVDESKDDTSIPELSRADVGIFTIMKLMGNRGGCPNQPKVSIQ